MGEMIELEDLLIHTDFIQSKKNKKQRTLSFLYLLKHISLRFINLSLTVMYLPTSDISSSHSLPPARYVTYQDKAFCPTRGLYTKFNEKWAFSNG